MFKCKFQELARKKIPTGDLECPPHIRNAKRIYRKIVLATDGSTGGSDGSDHDIDADEGEDNTEEDKESKEEEEEEEEEEGDGANTSFDFSVNDKQELEAEPEVVAAAAGGIVLYHQALYLEANENGRRAGGHNAMLPSRP